MPSQPSVGGGDNPLESESDAGTGNSELTGLQSAGRTILMTFVLTNIRRARINFRTELTESNKQVKGLRKKLVMLYDNAI